jgi:molybdate transport system permease protein
MDPESLTTAALTLRLAATSTALLLLLGTPLAWWLATTRSRLRRPVNALVALPLVLPPTVLGFYLLVAFSPDGTIGQVTERLGIGSLNFTFSGLVIASVVYSLPFTVQPLQAAFAAIGSRPLEVAATLGAGAFDRFFNVVLPLARTGVLAAVVLSFAHTVGEFGVVLMIGGNIPGETRVLSVAIYDHVEALEYGQAHWLAGGLLLFSFVALLLVNLSGRQRLFGGRQRAGA